MIALVWFTSRQELMGAYRNRPAVLTLAILAVVIVLTLNAMLVMQALGAAL
jgi:manganese transport protein